MRVQEQSEKGGLKVNIQKIKIMTSNPITSWQIDGEKLETVTNFIVFGSKITVDDDCSHDIKTLAPWMKSYDISSSVQFSHSVMSDSLRPHEAAHQAFLSITNSQILPKPIFTESVTPCSHLILCHPLLLLPSIFASIRVFSNESALHIRWSKYWSFSFNISPSNEPPGLISFRVDWLNLLAVHGLSIVFSNTTVQKLQFFGAQLSSQSNCHIHT